MKRCIIVLSACLLTGCQTAERSSHPHEAPDVVHYGVGPPLLIFITLPSLGPEQNRGYAAQIALPAQGSLTTNRIKVSVRGGVVSPGVVSLRSGGTFLEAVGCAGGLAPWALMKRLHVSRSGVQTTLYFHSRCAAGQRFRLVWCDKRQYDDPETEVTDFVLEDGDHIHVPVAVF
jgi:hypothetical protein